MLSPRHCLAALLLLQACAAWLFGGSSAKPEFTFSEYAAGEWTFDIMHSQSSPQGFVSLKNWTVTLSALPEGNNVAFVDSSKKQRVVFEMATGIAGVVQAPPLSLPQPSENVEIKAPAAAADEDDEFEEFDSSPATQTAKADELQWDEEAILESLCSVQLFEPAVGQIPLGTRVAFGHFLSQKVPVFYHLLLTGGRISLTAELERKSADDTKDDGVRSVFTVFGLKGQGSGAAGAKGGAAAGAQPRASWFGTYGPTALIVGFWVISWLQSWAKKNPMIQKAWKLAEEQAKEMQKDSGKKA